MFNPVYAVGHGLEIKLFSIVQSGAVSEHKTCASLIRHLIFLVKPY